MGKGSPPPTATITELESLKSYTIKNNSYLPDGRSYPQIYTFEVIHLNSIPQSYYSTINSLSFVNNTKTKNFNYYKGCYKRRTWRL